MKHLVLSIMIVPSLSFAAPSLTAPWVATQQPSECEEQIQDYKLLTDKLKEKIELQSKEITIMDQRLSNYITLSDSLSKDLGHKETTEGLYRFGYFSLGAIITVLIARNVTR